MVVGKESEREGAARQSRAGGFVPKRSAWYVRRIWRRERGLAAFTAAFVFFRLGLFFSSLLSLAF